MAPDVAGIALLRKLVRDDVAQELTYTARKMSGDEALSLGIVKHVDAEPYAHAMTRAHTIAAGSPDPVPASNRLFNLAVHADSAEIPLAESEEQQVLLASANHAENIAAAREKRSPILVD